MPLEAEESISLRCICVCRHSMFALLHLPLSFPPASSRPLTAWCSISVNLATLMSYFQTLTSSDNGNDSAERDINVNVPPKLLPGGRYSHLSYIKIYSNCRLRRIWFTESRMSAEQLPWEFQLYSSDWIYSRWGLWYDSDSTALVFCNNNYDFVIK